MDGNGYPTWNAGNSASIYTTAGTGNSNALIGVFTDASGVILGMPFIVGNGPLRKTAPLGAENLQLGINGPTGWLASNGGSLTVGVTVVATIP